MFHVEYNGPSGWRSTGFVFATREQAEKWIGEMRADKQPKYRVAKVTR